MLDWQGDFEEEEWENYKAKNPQSTENGEPMKANDLRLQRAMKVAVREGLIPKSADAEVYLKNWEAMGKVLDEVLAMSADDVDYTDHKGRCTCNDSRCPGHQ